MRRVVKMYHCCRRAQAPAGNGYCNVEDVITAAGVGHARCLATLLVIDPKNVDRADHGGRTALTRAAGEGNADCVITLLEAGANVDLPAERQPAIVAASDAGHLACVEALLRGGADVNQRDAYGRTALIAASQNGHADCVSALVRAKGVDLDARGVDGGTALQDAFHDDPRCLELLLEAGANPNVADNRGFTPLHYASGGFPDCVRILLHAGANPHAPATTGALPFHVAVAGGHPATWDINSMCARALVRGGAPAI